MSNMKKVEKTIKLKYIISGFGKKEECYIEGLVENDVVEIGNLLKCKCEILIKKINKKTIRVVFTEPKYYSFSGISEKNIAYVDGEPKQKLENGIVIPKLAKDCEVTLNVGDKLELSNIVQPSFDIEIQVIEILSRELNRKNEDIRNQYENELLTSLFYYTLATKQNEANLEVALKILKTDELRYTITQIEKKHPAQRYYTNIEKLTDKGYEIIRDRCCIKIKEYLKKSKHKDFNTISDDESLLKLVKEVEKCV